MAPQTQIDDAELVDLVAELEAAGETDPAGGVHHSRIAREIPFAETTIQTHLSKLADKGVLERTWGIPKDKHPRQSYSIPTPDAVESDGATTTVSGPVAGDPITDGGTPSSGVEQTPLDLTDHDTAWLEGLFDGGDGE